MPANDRSESIDSDSAASDAAGSEDEMVSSSDASAASASEFNLELPSDSEPIESPTCDLGSKDLDDHSSAGEIELSAETCDPISASSIETLPKQVGDYAIEDLIGSGGMGQVYLAEHVRMQRRVALKVLRADRMEDEAAVERFYDEVRAASRVMHPNIVTAFDAGEHEGIHYLVMEYVDGMTLTRVVAKNGPVSPGLAASMVRQAALGLLHAHRAGIIHRDVKPGNLIQAKDGTIKVLDLGLAQISHVRWSEDGRELGRMQDPDSFHKRKGKLIGTLAYMSPEQLESPDDADPRSDIYALGAVLFFLLCGRPPYQGEYLDQVYGHRYGEIPDLMQMRGDVDLGLANILRRMMAKSLSERYASLEEVVEDLGAYAEESHSPSWLTEFVSRQTTVDASTNSGGSTAIANLPVLGIDFGMTYAAVSEAVPGEGIRNLLAGDNAQPLFRLAIANDNGKLLYDSAANQVRMVSPRKVVHCLPMYIGKDLVERKVNGRKCPPEVLMSMVIRRLVANAVEDRPIPKLAAVAVPSSYDQFHRLSIKQAWRLAGIDSVRLVDRGIAAVQSMLLGENEAELLDGNASGSTDAGNGGLAGAKNILFIGLTGQATEVSIIQRDQMQLTELSTAGHWNAGMLRWQHRLVELAAKAFEANYGFDPAKYSLTASRLQMACERALNSLLLMPSVDVSLEHNGKMLTISIDRDDWLAECADLIHLVRRGMHDACKFAGVRPRKIDACVTLGPLLRISDLKTRLLRKLPESMEVHVVDRSDIARGAAACLAAELPQRTDLLVPPKCISSHTIGIVIEDAKGRARILPIIARGTPLPARSNRKLTIAKNRDSMTLSIVESSGIHREDWQALGNYEFEVDKDSENQLKRTRLVSFELNVDGLLVVRAQTPGTPDSTRMPTIPEPMTALKDEPDWIRWVGGTDA